MKEVWRIHTGKYHEIENLLKVDPVLAMVISNRTAPGHAADFMDRRGPLGNPFEIKDLPEACDLILKHRDAKDQVRIIGDYDVDGVTSASILSLGLRGAGIEASVRIPDRVKDGYGTRPYMIDEAIDEGCGLILTCDNGIREFDTFAYAKEKGIDVIITDHHEITKNENGQDLFPVAACVVNPHRQDCTYFEKGLCGAGVAYKLMQGLYEKLNLKLPDRLLGLAALGTVCDMMELTGENRRIVWQGLEVMNQAYQTDSKDLSAGLRAMMQEAGIDRLDVYRMGFVIGPMINAGGRLSSQQKYIQILMTEDQEEAGRLAGELHQLNVQRQDMTEKGVQEARRILETQYQQDFVKVLYLPEAHESLAGLIAGRVKEQYGYPCFVFTGQSDELKGSGRSIPQYDMFAKLSELDTLLVRYGGHKMAAGLTIKKENLEVFRTAVNEKCGLTEDDLVTTVFIDAQLPLQGASLTLAEHLAKLEPYGTGNPKPLFAERNIELYQMKLMGKDKNVARLGVKDHGHQSEMICFNLDPLEEAVRSKSGEGIWTSLKTGAVLREPVPLDVVYTIDINEYRGMRGVQCQLKHVR